ncbi:MAG: hypothetical protein ACRDIE_08970 [Chloroflexota bacterium]
MLIGKLSTMDLLGGLAMQVLWIDVGTLRMAMTRRSAVKRYSAVGN